MTVWEWAALVSAALLAGTFLAAKFLSIGTEADRDEEKLFKEYEDREDCGHWI